MVQANQRIAVIFTRMAEELGEVAEALLLDSAIDKDVVSVIKNEMADLGAWIFALANNLQYVDQNMNGITLADVAWELYPGTCHRCGGPKCVCVRGTYSLELAEKGAMGPSHWDELTGLGNINGLRQYIKRANSEFRGGDILWSIIFFDLDNFGAVNKKYSHELGDEVLREAAVRIRAAVGVDGVSFRRGGEEFMVVLRIPHEHTLVTAELIRKELDKPMDILFRGVSTKLTVTASIGVASYSIDGSKSVNAPSELEGIAEIRAGEAKKLGKNRVVPEVTSDHIRQYHKFAIS